MGYINGMIVQSSGSKPHVVFIMETLAKQFPYTIWKIGGYKNRTTAGGGFSFHSVGRACDIYLDAFDPVDKILGDLLFEMFHCNADMLLVDHVIWNSQIWSAEKGGPRVYQGSGGPHTNHIHVGFKKNPSKSIPVFFVILCKIVHHKFINSSGDAEDRARGLYGQAFNPKRPNKRLTKKQRKKILLENMMMQGA